MIIDSPIISGSYLSTGSLSQTGNVSITGSLTATAGVSGSFSGSGANLFNIPAAGIVGLNLSQIASGSVSASISPNQGLLINTSVSASNFTGSFTGSLVGIATSASFAYTASSAVNASASLTAITASFALTASYLTGYVSPFPFSGSAQITGSLAVTGSINATGNITTVGTITAQTLVVQTITSSIEYSSGSNIFGSQLTNTQTFTGSVNITGSAVNLKDGVFSGSGANLFGIPATGITGLNLSQISSGSVSASISPNFGLLINTSVSASSFTGSFSGSFSGAHTGSLFGTASFALDAGTLTGTGSVGFTTTASFLAVSASYISLSASYNTFSGSASTRITTVSSSQQDISSSLLQVSASYIALSASYNVFSGSTSTILTSVSSSLQQISASLLTISRSYASTGSNTFVGLETITGSLIVTGSVAVSTLVTSSGVRYVIADANGLISAQTASAAIFVTQKDVATSGQTSFNIVNGYSTGYVTVFVNGTKLSADEYTDTSGTAIVLATGSMVNDVVEFQKYMPAAGVSNNVLRTTNYFTTTLGQTNFTVNYTPGLLDVFYNGSKLNSTEYTAANGTSITLATGSNLNDSLEVDVYSYQVGAFSGIGGVGVAKELAFYNTTNSITGSNKVTYDGSTFSITGSFLVTGSSTFTNIGPAVFSGSVTAVGGFSGSFSGNADSASLAQNSLLLQGTGSVGFTTTASFLAVSSSQQQISASQQQLSSSLLTLTASYTALSSSYTSLSASYNTFSGSASTRITANSSSIQQVSSSQQQISSSLLNVIAIGATTGSNSFRANQSITGSLVVSSTITAQTLVVQTVTSSIVYSSGSNIFGCDLNSRQTFTGSVLITGSLTIAGASSATSYNGATIFGSTIACSPIGCFATSCATSFVGGTMSGTTIYGSTAVCSPVGYFSGCVGIGTINPGTKLEVYRCETDRATVTRLLTLNNNSVANPYDGFGMGILFKGTDYSNAVQCYGAIDAVMEFSNRSTPQPDTGFCARMAFSTGTNGALTERMRITSGGNVGISETSPTSKLSIGGVQGSTIGCNVALLIGNNGAAASVGNMIQIGLHYNPSGATPASVIGAVFASTTGYTKSDIFFATRDVTTDTAPTERMRITSCGYVGIGTCTPNRPLDVRGDAYFYASNTSYSEGINVFANIGSTSGAGINFHCAPVGTVASATTLKAYLRVNQTGTCMILGTIAAGYDLCAMIVNIANGNVKFACGLTATTIGTNDLILNNLNYECANYVDGTRGSWLIQEGACDLFIINQISCKKYKFNLIEIE